MSEFRKGDIVKVVRYGCTYSSHYSAFKYLGFKNPDHDHSSYTVHRNEDLKFKVLGIYEDDIVGIQNEDFQLAVGKEGLRLLYRGELNNRIKIL